jgi:hypothetical protein
MRRRDGTAKGEGMERYEHTQRGTWLMVIWGVSVLRVLIGIKREGLTAGRFIALLVNLLMLVTFSNLHVAVDDQALELAFRPGFISRRVPLSEIESCEVVSNCWYWGWGVRLTPHGTLYNVGGLRAVEVCLQSGRRVRVGSDEPERLAEAVRTGLAATAA